MKRLLGLSTLAILLSVTSIAGVASAAPYGPNYGGGTYHDDVLPNGAVTGPIAPDANGGG